MRDAFPLYAFCLAVPALLSACSVGPDFRTPAPPADLPAQFVRATSVQPNGESAEADLAFWRGFQDSRLTALVEQALAANHDLAGALARYDSANALLRESGFDRLPTVTANAQGGRTRRTADEAFGQPRTVQRVGGAIEANWELDFVGRVRRNIEAYGAEAAASAADLAALQIAIAGEVAATYVELRGLQERSRIAGENLQTQQNTLTLVTARRDAGRGTDFDVARARAQREETASRMPALEAQIAVHQHRLSVLTGRAPQVLIAELDESAPQMARPPSVNPGTPAALLRRRPDVRAAEERLHAAVARVGVATADLFPRVSLGGLIGTFASQGSGLFHSASETHSGLLGIDWSFLDVGRVRARIAASQAEAGAALADYQQAVLLALEDTENALVRYHRTYEEDEHLAQAARESDIALQLARTRMEMGNIDLFEVLDAQRNQLTAQDAWADSRMRSLRAAVALHQALAGGWPQPPASTSGSTGTVTSTADAFTPATHPSVATGTAGLFPAARVQTEIIHAH